MEPSSREHQDSDLRLTVHQAQREGADTAGLARAVADADHSLADARHMAEEADEHIRRARLHVDMDTEMHPRRGHEL